MNKFEEFNTKFDEYKRIVAEGEIPNTLFTTQLLLLADDVLNESDDVAGPKGEVDLKFMISQLGLRAGGLLGDIEIPKSENNNPQFLENFSDAVKEEVKAKKNAAEIVASTVVGLGVTAAKLAL